MDNGSGIEAVLTEKKNNRPAYILSFVIPVILLAIVFFFHGIYPFGDRTVMTGDMEYQFVDYLAYLKTIVFGNNDFSYSFSKNLGGSMAGFSAYYYYSPLNFITLFFPNSMLPVAESLVVVLTAALSSLTMMILLIKQYDGDIRSVAFSAAYAMCGFAATYFQLTMYSGNLILLPLIILGLLRLLDDPGKRYLYLITLSLAVLFNYYSGYMICIFAALFYILEVIKRGFDKKAFRSFVLSSLTAVLLTSFNLIPAVLSLRGEKNTLSLGFFRTFSLRGLPFQFLAGSFKGNVSTGLPNVFCGILILVLFIVYLLDKRHPIKERIADLLFLIFLLINFWLNILNIIWHGFNQPIGFPYRYSYMFSFFMILCAHKAFMSIAEGLLSSGKVLPGRILIAAFILFEIADLTYNYYDVMKYYSLASLSEYQKYLKETGDKLKVCFEDGGEDLYRIEKYFRRTNNDAMQFDYAGLSHFSSSEKKDKINFMGKLGFRNNGNWSFYNESTTDLLESFFGVKYILSQFSSTPNKYEKILKDEEINVFKNKDALPLIFTSTEKIRDVNYNGYNGDPFMLQEALADSLNGKENGIFEKAEILSFDTENLEAKKEGSYTIYKKREADKDAWIDVMIKVPEEKRNLFAYFDADGNQNTELYKDDVSFGEYFSRYRWNIISFHRTKKADETVIRIKPLDDSLSLGDMFFYYENRDRVSALMDEIKSAPSSIKKITSSHLTGTITVPEERSCVVLTIPYDRGWSVYLDGKKTEIKKAAGILMSFDAEKGTHNIEMRYSPTGRVFGMIVSIVVLLLTILNILYKKRKNNIF